MPRSRPAPRVVLDANLVLSALVFAQGRLSLLHHAWQGTHYQPLVLDGDGALIEKLRLGDIQILPLSEWSPYAVA